MTYLQCSGVKMTLIGLSFAHKYGFLCKKIIFVKYYLLCLKNILYLCTRITTLCAVYWMILCVILYETIKREL